MSRSALPRWPLRMHVWRVMLRLFGWVINRERHEEYKELLRENKRLRKAIRDDERAERRAGSRR